MRTFKIYSLRKIYVYNGVLLTVVTMLYITPPGLTLFFWKGLLKMICGLNPSVFLLVTSVCTCPWVYGCQWLFHQEWSDFVWDQMLSELGQLPWLGEEGAGLLQHPEALPFRCFLCTWLGFPPPLSLPSTELSRTTVSFCPLFGASVPFLGHTTFWCKVLSPSPESKSSRGCVYWAAEAGPSIRQVLTALLLQVLTFLSLYSPSLPPARCHLSS